MDATFAQVLASERAVWEALVAGDAAADAALLAPDFLGVYPTGFGGRADHAAQLAAGPTVAAYALSDVRLVPMGPDHMLLAYRADYIRAGGAGAGSLSGAMFVSSIWRREGVGWVNVVSQDTPVSDLALP